MQRQWEGSSEFKDFLEAGSQQTVEVAQLKAELAELKDSQLKIVGWRNPMNGVIIDDQQKRQTGVGLWYLNFSNPVYSKVKPE